MDTQTQSKNAHIAFLTQTHFMVRLMIVAGCLSALVVVVAMVRAMILARIFVAPGGLHLFPMMVAVVGVGVMFLTRFLAGFLRLVAVNPYPNVVVVVVLLARCFFFGGLLHRLHLIPVMVAVVNVGFLTRFFARFRLCSMVVVVVVVVVMFTASQQPHQAFAQIVHRFAQATEQILGPRLLLLGSRRLDRLAGILADSGLRSMVVADVRLMVKRRIVGLLRGVAVAVLCAEHFDARILMRARMLRPEHESYSWIRCRGMIKDLHLAAVLVRMRLSVLNGLIGGSSCLVRRD